MPALVSIYMVFVGSWWCVQVVKLQQCKIPLEKRFTFYDQASTAAPSLTHPST